MSHDQVRDLEADLGWCISGPELFDRFDQGPLPSNLDHQAPTIDEIFKLESGVEVWNRFIVMKETYIRQAKSWSFLFMVFGPFLFRIEHWIGYLTGSSTDAKTKWPWWQKCQLSKKASKEPMAWLDAKDEAAAKKPLRMRKQLCYQWLMKRWPARSEHLCVTACENDLKSLVTKKLSQVQQGSIQRVPI